MQYHQLGQSDLQVSSLGMGCVTFGRETDADASFDILDYALEKGFTLLDTAASYADGASERVVGQWIASRGVRDKIVLATKVLGVLTRENILQSADESLQRLNVDVIDLFQLHDWDSETPLDDQLAALESLVKAGKVRACGCSNWETDALSSARQAAGDNHRLARMQSIQPPYNLVQREIEQRTLPFCREHNVGVVAYSPLGAGFLTGKYREGGQVPKGTRFEVRPLHQDIYFTAAGWRVMEGLRRIAAREGRTMIQLALAWVMDQPNVTSVLIGARNTGHIDQALDAQAAQIADSLLQELSALRF